MKLLLDQGLPRSVAEHLRKAGHDAVHTGETGLATARDADIIEYAREGGRTVITLDADFHALIALEGASSPSVIRIREEGLGAEALLRLLLDVLHLCKQDIENGAFLSVTREHVRIRRLPVVG